MIIASGFIKVPAVGERFELVVPVMLHSLEPVVWADKDPRGWTYLGPNFSEERRYEAYLATFGELFNLDEGRKKAADLSARFAEGEAIMAFQKKFPVSDQGGPIVSGGTEWLDPKGDPQVACLGWTKGNWFPFFFRAKGGFRADCRYLMVEI